MVSLSPISPVKVRFEFVKLGLFLNLGAASGAVINVFGNPEGVLGSRRESLGTGPFTEYHGTCLPKLQ